MLDYKTDRPHAGLAHDDLDTWLAEKNEYYCPQLEVYRRAAAARCSLSPEAVTAKLVFVRLGEVIDCL